MDLSLCRFRSDYKIPDYSPYVLYSMTQHCFCHNNKLKCDHPHGKSKVNRWKEKHNLTGRAERRVNTPEDTSDGSCRLFPDTLIMENIISFPDKEK